MAKMKKQIKTIFGKKVFLLGVDHDGTYRWLEAPSWDCGWYWGFGYIEAYTNNKQPERSKDISEHTHWDSLFMNGNKNAYDAFKEFFTSTPLSDDELWELCDLMKSFYTLTGAAELFGRGYSYYTEKAKLEEVKDKDLVLRINTVMLPAIFEKIGLLFQDPEEPA